MGDWNVGILQHCTARLESSSPWKPENSRSVRGRDTRIWLVLQFRSHAVSTAWLGLWSLLWMVGFKRVYVGRPVMFPIFPMLFTCRAHIIHFDFITLIKMFVQLPAVLFPLRLKSHYPVLKHPLLCSFRRVRGQVFHPYRTAGKIVSCYWILGFYMVVRYTKYTEANGSEHYRLHVGARRRRPFLPSFASVSLPFPSLTVSRVIQ